MTIQKFLIIAINAVGFLSIMAFGALTSAQSVSNISYPIPELGNCVSQQDCKIFCGDSANYVACTQWATKNGLMPEEKVMAIEKEVEQIEKFESGEIPEGPGGCKNPAECNIYCQKPEHGEECFKFGTEHGLISPKEAEQIQKKVEENKGPGGCKTNEKCDVYCSQPEHAEECISYGVKDGTLTQSEANELREIIARERVMRETGPPQWERFHLEPKRPKINDEKVKEILKTQKGPGNCLTLEKCEEYCSDMNHAEECFAFARNNGLASSKELEEMENIMKTGGPGGCKRAKECDEYCSLPERQDECLKFAKEHGLASPEEEKMIEEMAKGRGGPGGCKSQQECDAYCREPQHIEKCLMFSVKQGMMSQEDAQRMIEIMKEQEERGLQMKDKPPEKEMAPQMPHMFEKGMPKQNEWHPGPGEHPENNQMPNEREFMPPEGKFMPPINHGMPSSKMRQEMPLDERQSGPGGCQSREECDAYCSKPEHIKECSEFSGNESMPPEGQIPPEGYEQIPPEGQVPPQGTSSSPETALQSFLKQMKNFLASLVNVLSPFNFNSK